MSDGLTGRPAHRSTVLGRPMLLGRPAAITALAAVVLASTVVGVGVDDARADGTPDITMTASVAPTTLYGDSATVTLAASNPTGTDGFN